MLLGWTQNVVIFEAELTIGEKAWYIRSAAQLGWSKKELIARIAEHEHEKNILDAPNILCYPDNGDTEVGNSKESESENTSEAETQGQDVSTLSGKKLNRKPELLHLQPAEPTAFQFPVNA